MQEANAAQERQQDMGKMAFEKLHTTQLLEKANVNINNIRVLLKVRKILSSFGTM
jgi:hypothetical protein